MHLERELTQTVSPLDCERMSAMVLTSFCENWHFRKSRWVRRYAVPKTGIGQRNKNNLNFQPRKSRTASERSS